MLLHYFNYTYYKINHLDHPKQTDFAFAVEATSLLNSFPFYNKALCGAVTHLPTCAIDEGDGNWQISTQRCSGQGGYNLRVIGEYGVGCHGNVRHVNNWSIAGKGGKQQHSKMKHWSARQYFLKNVPV